MNAVKRAAKNELNQLVNAIISLGGQRELYAFLNDLCTPSELAALTERWRVVPLLKQGLSYRDIHDKTGISVTTIGRVARALIDGCGGYDLAYKKLGGRHE